MKNSLRGYIVPLVLTIVSVFFSSSLAEGLLSSFGGRAGFRLWPFPVQISYCDYQFKNCQYFLIWWGIVVSVLTILVSFYLFNRFKNWIIRTILFFVLIIAVSFTSHYMAEKYIPVFYEDFVKTLPPPEIPPLSRSTNY